MKRGIEDVIIDTIINRISAKRGLSNNFFSFLWE